MFEAEGATGRVPVKIYTVKGNFPLWRRLHGLLQPEGQGERVPRHDLRGLRRAALNVDIVHLAMSIPRGMTVEEIYWLSRKSTNMSAEESQPAGRRR